MKEDATPIPDLTAGFVRNHTIETFVLLLFLYIDCPFVL
jgi:hypothetical protein